MDNSRLESIIEWLLKGDPSIRWQTLQDLTHADATIVSAEKRKTATQGWGARLLELQDESGLWAGGIYSPKWTSTTYTLLLLRRLGIPPDHPKIKKSCRILLDQGYYSDGGINYFQSYNHSETCVTGMILSILAYFRYPDTRIERLVGYLISEQMPDGGWNCQFFKGAVHGSFHTTISVLEGLREYEKLNIYGSDRIRKIQDRGCEFLLVHKLFRSHRTGNIIDPKMTRFSFPPRWHYDIMRVLDYFQERGLVYDERMRDAIDILLKKRRKDGTWPLQNYHPGKIYFEFEKIAEPSRWNTLRALRILQKLDPPNPQANCDTDSKDF